MATIIILFAFAGFGIIRCFAGLYWNEVLCTRALREAKGGGSATWYINAEPFDFIFNPMRWYIWTPAQYEKFLKSRYSND